MGNLHNGVKANTLKHIEFEQGLICTEEYKQGFTKDKILCATTGGIKVNITQNKQVISFDGVLDNTKGIERVIGWNISVQFSTKEVDANMIKLALGYATIHGQYITLEQGIINHECYTNELYIIGWMGDGKVRQISLKNVINTSGLQETRNSKGETEISFDLQAYYTVDDQDTPPIRIDYISDIDIEKSNENIPIVTSLFDLDEYEGV